MTLTSRVSGYTDKSIFLPAAGYIYKVTCAKRDEKVFLLDLLVRGFWQSTLYLC